jgi:hypothetical protein
MGSAMVIAAGASIGATQLTSTQVASADSGHAGTAYAYVPWSGNWYTCKAPSSHGDLYGYAGASTDANYPIPGYYYGCEQSYANVSAGYYPGPITWWYSGWKLYRSDVVSSVPASSSGSAHRACAIAPNNVTRACGDELVIFP